MSHLFISKTATAQREFNDKTPHFFYVATTAFCMGLLFAAHGALAQDEYSAGSANPSGKDTTSYDESFTTGDVVPAAPPEGTPDSVIADDRSPDEIVEAKMKEFEELDKTPSKMMVGVTGAMEFPHVLNLGLETLFNKTVGVSLNYGSLRRNISSTDVAMDHADVRFRYHPWQSNFFFGLGVGQHRLKGEKTKDVKYTLKGAETTTSTTVNVTLSSKYALPHIGWFAVWDAGFTMGLDLGVMVPIAAKSDTDVTFTNLPADAEAEIRNDADYQKLVSDAEDATASYGKKTLPFLTMLRVGWMF
jgi:hypothetical protein